MTAFSSYKAPGSVLSGLPLYARERYEQHVWRCGRRTWWPVVMYIRGNTPRGELAHTGVNYSGVGPPNYTIHLVPILRRLYYIALRRILAAGALLAARLFLAAASNLISPRMLRKRGFRNFCCKLCRVKSTWGVSCRNDLVVIISSNYLDRS